MAISFFKESLRAVVTTALQVIFANFQIILLAVKIFVQLCSLTRKVQTVPPLLHDIVSNLQKFHVFSSDELTLYKRFRDSIFIIVYPLALFSLDIEVFKVDHEYLRPFSRFQVYRWTSIKDLSALLLLVTYSIKTWHPEVYDTGK